MQSETSEAEVVVQKAAEPMEQEVSGDDIAASRQESQEPAKEKSSLESIEEKSTPEVEKLSPNEEKLQDEDGKGSADSVHDVEQKKDGDKKTQEDAAKSPRSAKDRSESRKEKSTSDTSEGHKERSSRHKRHRSSSKETDPSPSRHKSRRHKDSAEMSDITEPADEPTQVETSSADQQDSQTSEKSATKPADSIESEPQVFLSLCVYLMNWLF